MVDPGIASRELRSMMGKDGRVRSSFKISQYSFLSTDEFMDLRVPETRRDKIYGWITLFSAILQFLSALSLVLVSVSTLPYANPLFVFYPCGFLTLSAVAAGAINVTVVWLRFDARAHSTCLLCGLVLSVTGVVSLLTAAMTFFILARGCLRSRVEEESWQETYFGQLIAATTFLAVYVVTSLVMIGVLSYRLAQKTFQSTKASLESQRSNRLENHEID